MKKILITGADSYIGTSFENWIRPYKDLKTDTVDTLNYNWKKADFSNYDVVFHVAGLAHTNPKPSMKNLYYKINTELAVQIAEYAKAHCVKPFVFMSSIIVYGNNNTYITKDTLPTPQDFYGDSKLQADIKLLKLCDKSFNVSIIRPPMIYGKGSKGNYRKLSKLSQVTPIFPSISNQRSMLHIDNLCEFVKLIIENNESGIFHPQNKEYVSTPNLVKTIASIHKKNILLIGAFNPLLKYLSNKIVMFNKLFGDMVYEKSLSDYMNFKYCVRNFEKSIELTEETEK